MWGLWCKSKKIMKMWKYEYATMSLMKILRIINYLLKIKRKSTLYFCWKLLQGALVFAEPTNIPFDIHSLLLLKMQFILSHFISMHLQCLNGAISGSCSNISFDTSSTGFDLSMAISAQCAELFTPKCFRSHFIFLLWVQLYFLHTISINSPINILFA